MSAPATLPTPDILRGLSHSLAAIGALLGRGIGLWSVRAGAPPLALLAHARAGRLVARLQAILALVAAGRLPRSRPPRPPPPPRAEPAAEAPPRSLSLSQVGPPTPRLPGRVGWLMPHALDIRAASSQLRHWLADPAVQAVLAEVPQARKPLASLCRMLAIPPWPHPPEGPLPPPKPRLRRPPPREPKPRRETLAQVRASVWHHRCIETDTGFTRPGKRPWWMPPLRKRR